MSRESVAYALVTPVRNEQDTIAITIESVLAQTVLPDKWVIVSDDSTDGTNHILARYEAQHSCITVVYLQGRPRRSFSSVVEVTEIGLNKLLDIDYDFIGLLDADIRLPHDYYAKIIHEFTRNQQLGICGGLVVDIINGTRVRGAMNTQEVAGAVQFFRYDCLKDVSPFIVIPEGGWDAITCTQARMKGYHTKTLTDILVDHLKPRNSAEGGPILRVFQMGTRDYALGSHIIFEVAKCLSRIFHRPFLLHPFVRLSGFIWATLTRQARYIPLELVNHIRSEQLQRMGLRPLSRLAGRSSTHATADTSERDQVPKFRVEP